MAQGNSAPGPMHSGLTRQEATPRDRYDADFISLVHDTDFVPPRLKPTHYEAQEADTPLRQPLGYLTVRGREEPIFAPIPGFDHLFRVGHKDVASPWSSLVGGQRRESQRPAPAQPPSSARSHGVKRRRSLLPQDGDNGHDADEEAEVAVAVNVAETFHVGDVEALKAFYGVRFRELTMKPMRDIVTAWVKRLEPRRQQECGPYQRYTDRRAGKQKAYRKPAWWPAAVPYVEPSHLKLQHLVPLAIDVMLIHRRIDERKRKQDPWIHKLKADAMYLVTSKDTEHFSSSKGSKYNEAMKKRALEVILPSLFEIAQSHEDYVYQNQAFESSGKLNPGCGKQVSWQPAPRPDRTQIWKRPRTHVKTEPLPEDDAGDETEPDEEVACPVSSFSSFSSEFSYTEDVKMFPDVIRDDSPLADMTTGPTQPLHQSTMQPSEVSPALDVGQSLGRLHLQQGMDASGAPSTFDIDPSITGAPTNLAYTYPHHLTPDCFLGRDSQATGFSATVMVTPQDMNLTSRTTDYGLPTHCLPMHGMPMQELPTHGLPTHGLSARNLPTHGLTMASNWGSSF